ncbi:hypothetical protein L9F63_012795, partial [Diploptera punctata]
VAAFPVKVETQDIVIKHEMSEELEPLMETVTKVDHIEESLDGIYHPNQYSQPGDIDLTCKSIKCSDCHFLYKCKLDTHLHVHNNEKSLKCSFCNKNFSRNKDLQRHLQVHNTEKPFKCTICNKSFSEEQCLNKHLCVHSSEKRFKCPVCNRGFAKNYVSVHVRNVHSSEKQLKCSSSSIKMF